MSNTLKQRAENAALKKQIAFDRVQEQQANKFLQFVNKNLTSDRRRRAAYSATPGRADRDLDNYDRAKLISEARQIVEENPVAAALLTRHLDYVVGCGFKLSARSKDKVFNEDIEAAWHEYADNVDIRGMCGWADWLRMVQARKIIDGDIFILDADGKKALVEGDRCYAPDNKKGAGHVGIDYDGITGAPLRYYFGKRASYTQQSQAAIPSAPYELERVLHYMHNPDLRAERERGVSAFLPLLNALKDLDENLENMDIKIKNESIIGLIFKTDPVTGQSDGSLFSGLLNQSTGNPAADGSEEKRPYVKMQPGMNLDLMPGESADILESKSPHGSYLDYIRFRMRFVGLTLGFPLEFLFLDASDTNYSGLMMLAQMVRKAIKVHQAQLSRFASRIYLDWLGKHIAKIKSLPERHTSHDWGKPGVGFVDIGKEVRAFTELINTKLASRQQVLSVMGDGQDFEDLMDEIIDEQDYMHDKGVMYEIGNPGAVIINADEAGGETLEGGNVK